jgi:lipid-binding SYLF domain-containing protein
LRNEVLWQESLIDSSKLVLENLVTDEDVGRSVRDFLENAKGIYIEVEKDVVGFFVGVEGGKGLLLVKGEGGKWSSPAFMTSGGVSLGLQFGAMRESSITLFLTNKSLLSVIEGRGVKGGVGLRGAVGRVGSSASSDVSDSLENDVVVFGLGSGMYVGAFAGLDGLNFDVGANDKFYNADGATLRGIVLEGAAHNDVADGLREKLNGLTAG